MSEKWRVATSYARFLTFKKISISCRASFAAPVWPQACARVGDSTIFFKERVVCSKQPAPVFLQVCLFYLF